jgi:hypothetical protein
MKESISGLFDQLAGFLSHAAGIADYAAREGGWRRGNIV